MKHLTLEQLADHPKNVRARDEADERIDRLTASIRSFGLLQSLVVQPLGDGRFGVVAGRRRLLALRALAATGELDPGFKAPVMVIPKDADHAAAVSLAENFTQERMTPLDEYEAFASMIEDGGTPETIAADFGVTVRHVKERLRYGLVHADIRAAARAEEISLDVMKAYAGHPDPEVQKRVFEGLKQTPHDHQTWRVRRALEDQDVRADSAVGAFILDDYRTKGGAMVEGLFEEDTVLTNAALVREVAAEKLAAAAEAERARLGLKWAEGREKLDYEEIAGWGRICRKPLDLGAAEETRLTEIAARLDDIAEELEAFAVIGGLDAEDEAKQTALSDEYDRLEEESDDLQTAYAPDDAARAGVIASLDHSGAVRLSVLVRPEDRPNAAGAGGSSGAEVGGETDADETAPLVKPLSQSLLDDLASERAELVAAAIAEDPALAYDAIVFRAAADCFGGHGARHAGSDLDISFRATLRGHSRREAVDPEPGRRIEAARAALDLTFLDDSLSPGAQFRRLRALESDAKAAILASAAALGVMPLTRPSAGAHEDFGSALALEAVPETRALWRPAADNFWMRVSKPWMLALLESLGMAGDADSCRSMKKAALAAFMERLFAEPFATLDPDQRAAVEAWAPEVMAPLGVEMESGASKNGPEVPEGGDPEPDASALTGDEGDAAAMPAAA